MQAIRLGLIGANGRMGTALCEYLRKTSDIAVHATLELDEPLAPFLTSTPGVVVDLSLGTAVDAHGPEIVRAKLPYIVGATGYREETVVQLQKASEHSKSPVLLVPNFSLGANLMVKFAAAASRFMDYPAITERHHAGKADAPSGTARFTAQRIGEAQVQGKPAASEASPQYRESLAGVLGAREEGVALHSLRGTGYLAEQEVRFCLPGESLLIEHRSIDRRCFMPGVVFAIRNISKVRGLQVGLDTILEV